MTVHQMEEEIKKRLSPKRYRHCLNVKEKALELGKHYLLNDEKVLTAALLHDIAKDVDLLKSLEMALHLGVAITPQEERNPALIHSKLGAAVIEKELGIKDREIIDAIKYHTTGNPGMGMLEMLIYVSDYLDPEKKLENHDLINETAKTNLSKAALLVCVEKLKYSMETFKHIDQRGLDFYNSLIDHKK